MWNIYQIRNSDKPLLLSEATNISAKIFKEEKEEKRIGFDVE